MRMSQLLWHQRDQVMMIFERFAPFVSWQNQLCGSSLQAPALCDVMQHQLHELHAASLCVKMMCETTYDSRFKWE